MSASPAAATLPDVTVTMIDTGVRVTHQEFNYVSQTNATDQVVAWWDFSSEASPANHLPSTDETWESAPLWDTTTNGGGGAGEPFDNHGHGTATASSAVGLNATGPANKLPSFCPGCKLAIAKVGTGDGAVDGNLAAAVKWARETVQSDVISMSIGEIVPFPAAFSGDLYREIRLARQAGILVVLSNGNGWANFGLLPGEPGFATGFANSPYALGVGASGTQGAVVTTDPEVAAAYTQRLASRVCNSCYGSISGTSFSAPYVAGFAMRMMQETRANGFPGEADYIEKLVKYAARDNLIVPPTFEGYGTIDAAQLSGALTHAAAGTLPGRPSTDVDGLYVETVQGTLDSAWTEKASEGSQNIVRAGTGTLSPIGTIGASAPTGLSDIEVYKIVANAGDVVTANLAYTPPDALALNDIDLYVLRIDPMSGLSMPTGSQLVTKSANAGGVDEAVKFIAPSTGEYYVVAMGWSIYENQPFSLTSSKTLEYWYQDYALHTFGTGIWL